MRIWRQHGSEHSANLVMIGHFRTVAEAAQAKEIIDALTTQVAEDRKNGTTTPGGTSDRYGDAMLDLLGRLNISVGPMELEQFAYDFDFTREDSALILTTEELDISAFLKVMILKGARIEVYSAHDVPDSPHGRGR